jgi:hypothetical protein
MANKIKNNFFEVAVICPSFRDFKIWLLENKKDDEIYTWVYSINCVRGKRFHKLEKLYRWMYVKDIDDILTYIEMHIIKINN